MIVVYGMLADASGRPIALEAYAGDTSDPVTVSDSGDKMREQFGIRKIVLIGNCGMLTKTTFSVNELNFNQDREPANFSPLLAGYPR